ncbi:MAG: hypothetical protein PHE06_02215 [Lachnospiraceae bacterium]|nr:hypothetical protein [Lachnospiraceae bacterium]MDD3794787.1 hypothetical protein [Lachnospiraceae bacterium]
MKKINKKDLYIMMYSLQALQSKGISIKETIYESLEYSLLWYQQSQKETYLEAAALHMQAYANMGYVLDDQEETIKKLFQLTGTKKEDYYPDGFGLGKTIRLNRQQVRSMIGKWMPSATNQMTIREVVDDIIQKVSERREGKYIYEYCRKTGTTGSRSELYELVIGDENCYFYDVKNFKYYTFIEETGTANDKYSNFG